MPYYLIPAALDAAMQAENKRRIDTGEAWRPAGRVAVLTRAQLAPRAPAPMARSNDGFVPPTEWP